MGNRFDLNARTGFWKPADPNTICALEEAFCEIDDYDFLSATAICKRKLTENHHATILEASRASDQYFRIPNILTLKDMFQNEALLDPSGDRLFRSLGCVFVAPWFLCTFKLTQIYSDAWGWSGMYMESRKVFSSPGHPHVTVLSIQPQRASSQGELLCTEYLTLFYWSQRLAPRAFHMTDHCLPVSLDCSVPDSWRIID